MTQQVWLYLIVAGTIVVIVFFLRERLSSLLFRGGGIEAKVTAHKPPTSADNQSAHRASTNISGNKLIGERQGIEVDRSDTNVSGNIMKGKDQEILVKSDNPQQQ